MIDQRLGGLWISTMLLHLARWANLFGGAAAAGLLVLSFAAPDTVLKVFAVRPARIDPGYLLPVLRAWTLLAVPMVLALDGVIGRLLAIVRTVGAGDPFVPENARRMQAIAWRLLAVQLLYTGFGAMAGLANAAGSRIEWRFSATGWLGVALVFVLAQVFAQGTRLRGDLAAMI